MYGGKGSSFLNTVTLQSALRRQSATVYASNETSTLLTNLPTRSCRLYTSFPPLKASASISIGKTQQQLKNTSLVSLGRTSVLKWITQPINKQHQRFNSSLSTSAFLEPVVSDLDTRILGLAKDGKHRKVISEFNASKHDFPLAPETYEAVVESCHSQLKTSKPLTDMMGVYDTMMAQDILPTSTTFATIIRSLCAREGEVDRVSRVMRRQVGDINASAIGVKNLHKVLNGILQHNESQLGALESERNLQNAVSIFEQAIQTQQTQAFDISVYNSLLTELARHGNVQDGLYVYEQLENTHTHPTDSTFVALISMFGKAGDLQAAMECFSEYKMVSRTLPRHDSSQVHNAVVSAHVNAGDLEGAITFLNDTIIKNRRIRLSMSPYNSILQGAFMNNNMELVDSILGKLKSDKDLPDPTAFTYGLLLSAYSQKKNMDRAHEAFDQLISMDLKKQYSPIVEYVSACLMDGQYTRSMDILRKMDARGLKLDTNLCCQVIAAYMDTGDGESTAAVVKEVLTLHNKAIAGESPLADLAVNVAMGRDSLVDSMEIMRLLHIASVLPSREMLKKINGLYDNAKANPTLWKEFVEYSTKRSYTIMYLAAFTRDDMVPRVFELLDDMHALNIQPSLSLSMRVVTRLNQHGHLEDLDRWNKTFEEYYPMIHQQMHEKLSESTSTSSPPPNPDTVFIRSSEALNLLFSDGIDKSLDFMNKEIIEQGMVPESSVVKTMIQHMSHSSQMESIDRLYNLVVGTYNQLSGTERSKATYNIDNTMLTAYGTILDSKRARLYYDKLRGNNNYPDAGAYAVLLLSAAKDPSFGPLDAMAIYEEAKKHNVRPTTYFYNVIISRLSKGKKWTEAETLFKEMKSRGVAPSSVSYNAVIHACLQGSREDRALQYLDEMVNVQKYKPQIALYNSLIQYYVRQRGDRNKALVYFDMVKQANLAPTIHTYRLIIEAYANIPDYDMASARNVLGDMKLHHGMDPAASHYAALINSYGCLHRDVPSAEAVFEEMIQAEVSPNLPVYKALVDTYITNNSMQQAEDLYTQMPHDIASLADIENLFIQGYGAVGQVGKAKQVFDRTENSAGREPSTYKAMVKVYMEHGQMDKATQVFRMMKGHDYPAKVIDEVALLVEGRSPIE